MATWLALLKKYWWVVALAGIAILGLILKLVLGPNKSIDELIQLTKDRVRDADTHAELEKAKSATESAEKKAQLEQVKKIENGAERRKQLAQLLNKELS